MKLSVVIVNYNVKHFLEQCLHSVYASTNIEEPEVFVVDNNSVDGSCAMVNQRFPNVKLIANKENLGFSAANNQAINLSRGEYVLLLNPDTIVEEQSFSKIINFMDSHPECGGLGVKMINGKGKFLPESKRGLPTPKVSFYKIFGLSKLFPSSKRFGQYHLTFLDKDKIHEVDVLSGAFMLLRKTVLDEIGLLDEAFFMYGEDIDLSYRIQLAGYKNYYYPETTIIHYKGESTKKGSINYVMIFYKAMIIFARKHFTGKKANMLTFLINIAIYFRASLAIFHRLVRKLAIPSADALIFFSGFYLITMLWANHKYGIYNAYPKDFSSFVLPVFWHIWMFSVIFSGGYDKPLKIINLFKGMTLGSILILLTYSLLPEHLRFSRAIILLVSLNTFILVPITRYILHRTGITLFKINLPGRKRMIIVGKKDETIRVQELIKQTGINPEIVGYVQPDSGTLNGYYLGALAQLDEIIKIHKIDEIIFCSKDIEAQEFIKSMLTLANEKIDFKIAGPDGISVIGSNSINTAGELYTIDINSIGKPENRRKKRLLDVILALGLFVVSPIIMWIKKNPFHFLRNTLQVLIGIKTFVGYYTGNGVNCTELPSIKKGIISTTDSLKINNLSKEIAERSNLMYAKNYKTINDIILTIKCFKKLWK